MHEKMANLYQLYAYSPCYISFTCCEFMLVLHLSDIPVVNPEEFSVFLLETRILSRC